MKLRLPAVLLLCAWPLAQADPVITEFMASNRSTLTDENGDFSDWIEIHNPGSQPVALSQWCLTDTASIPTRWRFPEVTLEPGGFQIVWASGKNRRVPGQPLHTNFSLDKDGEFLALVRPDGSVAQSFAPKFPVLGPDESYGLRFNHTALISPGDATRYRAPASDTDPPASWVQPSFADGGWSSGPSGLGYGITVPGISVRQVFKNGAIGGLADTLSLLAAPAGSPSILSEASAVVDTVNFLGDGPESHFTFSQPPPGGSGDQYALKATGFVEIPTAGFYTFGKNTDDGGSIRIDGTDLVVDDAFHSPADSFGSRFLSAGLHSFEVVMFEATGGDCLEFFAAPGQLSAWDAGAFRLVGDIANGGLAASTMPAGTSALIRTNVQSALTGKPGAYFRTHFDGADAGGATALSLVMRYQDGFAAWLDGAPVASQLAPASPAWDALATGDRSNGDALRPQAFNLTSRLSSLGAGDHVLALQGLKRSAADGSFLILPELIAGSLDPAAEPAYYGGGLATPGWINGAPSTLGKVAATLASVERGIFSNAFTLTLSSPTPSAVIRYTTDGSTPTDSHGTVYSGPLTISRTTVLRTRATRTDWVPSAVATHTYLFPNDVIVQSPTGAPPAGWPAGSGTGQVLDFGMDPAIVNNANPDLGGPATVKAALLSLPSVSLTTDLPNLFNIDGSQGIYANPNGRGFSWERPVSVEWINPPDALHPNGASEFQIDAGLRIRGGYSRSTDNPKHALRLFFRDDYGAGKLVYPLFGRRGATEFDKIDLRTAQNYSWSFDGSDSNTFLREEAARQAQLDMGQPGSRVRYFHLYLNGQYWGLYDLDERTDAAFSESYLGGDKDDYDVVKAEGDNDYQTSPTDGSIAAWQDLWNKGKAHRASPVNANYFEMSGLAADGVTPIADPVLLDPDNLIDYLLLTFWTGNLDGCTSAFLGNDRANNWAGSRSRVSTARQGFHFFVHDFEHTFFNVNEDRTGPYISANESNFVYSNPLFLHQDLMTNAEYRMRWADRIHKHLFAGGALHPTAWQNRINRLATVVDQAIAAESARWGDAKSPTAPKTRQTWINAQNALLNYLEPRAAVVLGQLQADGLYPSLAAPVLTPQGGPVPAGIEVAVSGPAGATLHYMPDGSDPRAVGGALRSGALTYTSATASEPLVPWSASGWKYLANGSNQGTAWRQPGFNDTGWPTGTAELGYGDGDENTVLPIVDVNPTAAGIQKAATYYFRRTFALADLSGISGLTLDIEYDDAYAVYLNGVRIAGNLPTDPASGYYSGTAVEDTLATSTIDPALLQAGTNTLAIEIHQAVDTSTDVSMNASLALVRSTTPTPLVLTGAGERALKFRAKNGATWSALAEADYLVDTEPASPANLAISKIMYHPADLTGAEETAGIDDEDQFEYVELLNTGDRHVDLQGVYLAGAISFDFTGAATGRTLAPGARVLVVADPAAFAIRYGAGKPIAGRFSGKLENSGGRVILLTPGDTVIREVNYQDDAPWPLAADGSGAGLVARNPADPTVDGSGDGWRASGSPGGAPGEEDLPRTGSFDEWALTAFTPAQRRSAALAGLTADPDGDGRPNLEEFALATDPLTADRPEIAFAWSGDPANPYLALKIRRPATVSGVSYELQAGDDLTAWQTVATVATESVAEPGGTERALFRDETAPGAARRFLRVRVTPVP